MHDSKKNTQVALSLIAVIVGMGMLSYAAVPLYNIFCQVTGFGGTTQRASAAPTTILDRTITVTFNADTDPNLPWKFRPLQRHMQVQVGASNLAAYEAVNISDQPTTAMATYNVTPFEAGPYFHKVYCFCFEEQILQPHQQVNMPVSFYIDPAIDKDPNLDGVKNITLSYTFFSDSSKNR
ncbi:MAG: cytochrome c oxidase assembly protein [Rickettsiales bacterium]|nr:cytochrome c oxidase assembly protein [Rickettsiales bacterium]|tara:strand:+ start:649 stop:1188 length:540 start_codon:yes stop_codon:yes gene_type:complete